MNNKLTISLSLVLLAFTLVPLLILTLYIHPATDDYGFWLSLQKKNIFEVLMEITATMDNRVSGNFFTLLFCQTGSLFYYRLQLGVFIILFFSSIYCLFASINNKYLQTDKVNILFVFSIFSFLFVGYMPGLSEAFYWYPGVAVWILGIIMFNLFIILVLNYPTLNKTWQKLIIITLICILAFAMCTQNEINLLFMFLVLLYSIWRLITKKEIRYKYEFLVVSICIFFGLLITVIAKGNYERLHFISTKQYQTFLSVVIYDLLIFRKQFFFSNVIVFNILLIPIYYFFTPKLKEIHPIKLLLISSFLLFYMLVPSLIARMKYSFRIIDFVYYFFILIIIANFINLTAYLKNTKKLIIHPSLQTYSFVFVFFFFVSYLAQKETVIRTAYEDLYLGSAKRFDTEMNIRYKYLAKSTSDTIVLKPLINKPKSIFADDISNDASNWKNTLYAEYFKKKSIYLKSK